MAYFSPVRVTTKFVMTSIHDFKIASFKKKCEHVTLQTTYITSRCEEEKKYYLYHTGHFFIEVCYSSLSKRVLHIHAFNHTDTLQPYVVSVSLEEIKL